MQCSKKEKKLNGVKFYYEIQNEYLEPQLHKFVFLNSQSMPFIIPSPCHLCFQYLHQIVQNKLQQMFVASSFFEEQGGKLTASVTIRTVKQLDSDDHYGSRLRSNISKRKFEENTRMAKPRKYQHVFIPPLHLMIMKKYSHLLLKM